MTLVRIVAGQSWKLNPRMRAQVKAATGKAAERFEDGFITDVLGVEVDGVNIGAGLSEGALFRALDDLARATSSLCRSTRGTGLVSLSDGHAELVLGRRGNKAVLALVSLSRPARVLAADVEVDLPLLCVAVADAVEDHVAALTRMNSELAKAKSVAGMLQRAASLRRFAPRPGSALPSPSGARLVPEPARPPALNAPAVGFALFDDHGRVEAYRKGPDLYSLLAPGLLFLRDVHGEELALAKAPPFLALTELVRAAGEILFAVETKETAWRRSLAQDALPLELDLLRDELKVGGRAVPCRPLALARSFLDAAIDFTGAIVARNRAQAQNPYLEGLADSARDKRAQLAEVEAGDVVPEAPPKSVRRRRKPAEDGITANALKKMRFARAFSAVDAGGPPLQVAQNHGTLLVATELGFTAISATGAVTARQPVKGVQLTPAGALCLLARDRVLGTHPDGREAFLRDVPGAVREFVTSAVAVPKLGRPGRAGVAAVFDGYKLTAYDASTGLRVWDFLPAQAMRVHLAAGDELVYAASDNGTLYGIDPATGYVSFRYRSGVGFESAPLVLGDRVLVIGRDSGLRLVSCDALSGKLVFSASLILEQATEPIACRGGYALGGVCDGRSAVQGVTPAGELLFHAQLPWESGAPRLCRYGDRLFASTRDGALACLTSKGRVLWRVGPSGLELDRALPPLVRRRVLFAPGDPVRVLDPKSGTVLTLLPPTQGLAAMLVDEALSVVLVDDDGVVEGHKLATHLSVVG